MNEAAFAAASLFLIVCGCAPKSLLCTANLIITRLLNGVEFRRKVQIQHAGMQGPAWWPLATQWGVFLNELTNSFTKYKPTSTRRKRISDVKRFLPGNWLLLLLSALSRAVCYHCHYFALLCCCLNCSS